MNIENQTINTLRVLAAEMVQQANSGHPGAPMGMAPMAYALWFNELKHDPAHPAWPNRDRFVLSNGHASALLYVLLHLSGYSLTMDDLRQFRQWRSKTPGHPEYELTEGVETTTGPLGQGVANAVGFAIAETMLAAHFNRPDFPIVDHRTFAFAGDGCMMEGIASEACSLAGTLELSKLTILYDDNEISIEGDTQIAFRENVGLRFEAYGWNVVRVADGNDWQQVLAALQSIRKSTKPNLIICPTIIGYGSQAKAGKASVHGEPLGADNLAALRQAFNMQDEAFAPDAQVYAHIAQALQPNRQAYADWQGMFERYQKAYPDLAQAWQTWHTRIAEDAFTHNKALWEYAGKAATRAASGETINRLASLVPNLVGGSADLAPSNKTYIKDGGDYSAENRAGRNLHFGVREHAMAAICNGLALHGGLNVFCATFFVFTDYMKAAMRLSAIMKLPVIYVLTHDSIGVGEDGTTHQPIEHLAALRSIPDMTVIRPADGHETSAAWLAALSHHGPTSIILTRQNLPLLAETDQRALLGAYVLLDGPKQTPDIILMASGSEVSLVYEAGKQLLDQGVSARIVSMPSMEQFERQEAAYRESVLPIACRKRLAVEMGCSMPWYRYNGLEGRLLTIDHFGTSAPAEVLFEQYGFTAENVLRIAKEML